MTTQTHTSNPVPRLIVPATRTPYPTARTVPPAPLCLVPAPAPDFRAADGTASLPVQLEDANGWAVLNQEGRCRELLLFPHGHPPTSGDIAVMREFADRRECLADPQFAEGWDEPAPRAVGPTGACHVQWVPVSELPDGSQTLEVVTDGDWDALIVVDAEGDIVDAVSIVDPDGASDVERELLNAFLKRRLLAGDQWFEQLAEAIRGDDSAARDRA